MIKLLLIPLFLHVVLIYFVGSRLLRARVKSVRTGETKLSDIAVNPEEWPRRVRALGNNFDNQFDLPTLWYAVCALMVSLQLVDIVQVVLSWLFLLCRFGFFRAQPVSPERPKFEARQAEDYPKYENHFDQSEHIRTH